MRSTFTFWMKNETATSFPGFKGKIDKMTFASGQKVNYKVNEFGLVFSIPDQERDSIDTIVTMRVRR